MLRLSWIPLLLGVLACACPCRGQDASYESRSAAGEETEMTFTRTPEMWLYEQERIRNENPKTAVRRRAEFKAAQRANRMASMKWYGMSKSRPNAFSTPSMGGSYSPYWGSNTYEPYRWRPFYTPSVVLRPVETR